jgi:hypothetical protein
LLWSSPFLGRTTRYHADIGLRLRRQSPLSSKPVTHALWTGIVSGRCQPEIAELGPQVAQELGRFRQRLGRIERIVQKALCGRHRHKLGDALSPLTAARHRPNGIGPKAALLPNEESDENGGHFFSEAEALHVVERFRLIDYEAAKEAQDRAGMQLFRLPGPAEGWLPDRNYQGKGLQLQFTVEDEGVFTMPWSATITYRRVLREWPETVCADNPHVYYGQDTAVPRADKPDF